MNVLIVEDEPKLASVLRDYLVTAGHHADMLHDGALVVPHVRQHPPDIILLDVMLPNKDGLAICREIRAFSSVPIIFLTARVEEIDRILGLELGADDYICKPYSPREVVARISAIMRRLAKPVPVAAAATTGADELTPAVGLVLNRARFELTLDGKRLDVTPVEFRLLWVLAATPGRVFSRKQLMAQVYDDDRIVTDRTMDSHIKNLRKKLTDVREDADVIESVYGVGYRLRESADTSAS